MMASNKPSEKQVCYQTPLLKVGPSFVCQRQIKPKITSLKEEIKFFLLEFLNVITNNHHFKHSLCDCVM